MSGLGINVGALVAQTAVFGVLLAVLWIFVFPVLTKTLDERKLKIQEGIDNAEKAKQDLASATARIEGMLNDARLESQKVIATATTAAERLKSDIEAAAQQRGREIERQAQQRIEQQIAKAKADLRQHVADLAIAAAEKVIGGSMDNTTNRRLVDEFVSQSRDSQC